MMRRLLLTLLLALVASSASAQVPIPRIYRTAEQAVLPTASSNCSVTGATTGRGTGIQCSDSATLTAFRFWVPYPSGTTSTSWGVRIGYTAPAATSICAWDVGIGALDDGAVADNANASWPDATTALNQAHSANTVYMTNQASVSTIRLSTGAACASAACSARLARVDVKINSVLTTSASCTLKFIELTP